MERNRYAGKAWGVSIRERFNYADCSGARGAGQAAAVEIGRRGTAEITARLRRSQKEATTKNTKSTKGRIQLVWQLNTVPMSFFVLFVSFVVNKEYDDS